MFKSKASMRIISLIAAVALWLYVMGEVDPETRTKINDIPVSFVNTEVLAEYGMAVAADEQMMISASISGKRSDVNEVKKNGLTAGIDVAEFELGENTGKISINVPDGIKVENASSTTVTVNVEEMVYEYKPVSVEFSNTESSSDSVADTTPWVMEYYPKEITVMGAESSVNKVVKLLGVVNAEDAVTNKDTSVEVELIPVNKKGKQIFNVSLYQDEADAVVRKLSVSTVKLILSAEEQEIDVDKLAVEDHIDIAGPKEILENIKAVNGTVSTYNGKVYIDTDLPENVFIMIGEDDGKIIWN